MAEFGERGGNRNGAFWITQGQAGYSKWTFSTPRICRSSMHQPGSHYCQAIKRTYVPSVAKKGDRASGTGITGSCQQLLES